VLHELTSPLRHYIYFQNQTFKDQNIFNIYGRNSGKICSYSDSEIIISFYPETENLDLANYMSNLFQTDSKIFHFFPLHPAHNFFFNLSYYNI